MRIVVSKAGTLQTAQLMSEKVYPSIISECVTRKMTQEDWEKYGPLNSINNKEMNKSKNKERSHN